MDRSTRLLGITLALIFLIVSSSFGQSGRGRQSTAPPPNPKPTPKPNMPATTVLGVPEGGKLVKQDLDGLTSRFILRNGLTVIIRERHSAPLVSVNVTVKAGSVNESDEMAGMSLLARQMILRGTSKRSGAAFDREVAKLGGVFTSQATYDQTSFNIIAPSESYQHVIGLLADLIQRPALNAEDLKRGAQLVVLEVKHEEGRIDRASVDKLYTTAFMTNRMKRGMSVSETMLSSVTREEVLAFYQNFYHPSNTIVTIVGDIFSLKALGQVQLQFGDFRKVAAAKPSQPASTRERIPVLPTAPVEATTQTTPPATTTQTASEPFSTNPEEPPQDKLRYANSRAVMSQSVVTIGHRLPTFKPDKEGLKELATNEMLAAVLGLGNSSRLHQGLREGQATRDKLSVANETSAKVFVLPGAVMLLAELRIDPDRIDRAEADYFREIDRFRREVISDGELQRARAMLEKRYYDTISKFEEEAGVLSRYQAQLGDYRLFDTNLSRIRAVTAREIQQSAANYLMLANTTVHEFEPQNARARTFTPEKFAELIVTFAAGMAQGVKAEEAKPAIALKTFTQGSERGLASEGQNLIIASVPLPIKDYSVLRGPRAYVREDKAHPKLSVSVIFQGGRLIEDRTTSGMTELMLRVMLKSTNKRRAELIALELESYGGEIRIVNEPDFYGYTLDVLSRNADPAVKLLLEIIEYPFFDKEELVKERDALLARQLSQRDNADAYAIELMWASLYPDHPYGLPRFGLADVVKSIEIEKLEGWHTRTIQRQYPLVVVVGDTDGSALISRIFSEGLKRGDLDKSIKVNLPGSPGSPQEKIEQRGRQLTAQAIGFRLPGQTPAQATGRSNDLLAFEILSHTVSSGKMINDLRDKEGMTESLSIEPEQRLAAGAFFAQFSTLPENEQRSREVVQAELQRLAGATTSDEEFEQGRNAAIGRYAIALQSHVERGLEYARAVIFDSKPSDVEAQPDLIRSVKKADIKRVAGGLIKMNEIGRGVVRASK